MVRDISQSGRSAGVRRTRGAALLAATALVAVLLQVVPAAAVETPGAFEVVAGGLGDGPATDVSQAPVDLAVYGSELYVADSRFTFNVVRRIDLRTGQESVVAGERWTGFTGDGGPATEARMASISALAVDGHGNLYIADRNNGRVRRVDRAGTITTVAGGGNQWPEGGPATSANIGGPTGLAFDAHGNLFITTSGNQPFVHLQLFRVDPQGSITEVLRRRDAGSCLWDCLAVSPAGELHMIEDDHRIVRVDAGGATVPVAGSAYLQRHDDLGNGGPALEATLHASGGIAFDGAGNLYFSDDYNQVRRVDGSGTISRVAGGPVCTGDTGCEFGVAGFSGDGGPGTAAKLYRPGGLAFDGAGNLYVADISNNRVRRLGPGGIITTVAGRGDLSFSGDGRPATSAQLLTPTGLAVDRPGNLYIADSANSRIRKVTPNGMITTIAGRPWSPGQPSGDGGPATDAGLLLGTERGVVQSRVAVDMAGNVYFTESNAHRVRRVDPSGVITTVAGTGEIGNDGPEGPATRSRLFYPCGLAVDRWGTLYIGESDGRVRKVTPSGVMTTVVGYDGWGYGGDGGPARSAKVGTTCALAVDGNGNLFIADGSNHRIRKIDTSGIITTVVGNGDLGLGDPDPVPVAHAHLHTPSEVTVDAAGRVYWVESSSRIRMLDLGGTVSLVAEDYPGETLGGPEAKRDGGSIFALAIGPGGDLFAAQDGWSRVLVLRGHASAGAPETPAAWGWNNHGQLGDGSTVDRNAPVQVSGPAAAPASAVAAGGFHSLALGEDGTVSAWGWNPFGQVGDGTRAERRRPVAVSGLTDVQSVAAGAFHSLAVREDGTVWAWGLNTFGQLGDGSTTDRLAPVQVVGLTDVKAVAAGAYHSVAVRNDGSVWAWGWNALGMLGDGTLTGRSTPVRVPGLSGLTGVSAGAFHTLALGQDGAVWSWGWNGLGQLGDGSAATYRAIPVRVSGLAGIRSVAAGAYHSLALAGDGTLRSWGMNGVGQLGDGSTIDRRSPVRVAGLTGVGAVTAGGAHTLASTSSGAVFAWGWNAFGQLGDGTGSAQRLPTHMTTLPPSATVAAGYYHSVAT